MTNSIEAPVEREARMGLSKKLGNTGFRIVRGGHWPWDYLVYQGDVAIAGVSDEFFKILRSRGDHIGEQHD